MALREMITKMTVVFNERLKSEEGEADLGVPRRFHSSALSYEQIIHLII